MFSSFGLRRRRVVQILLALIVVLSVSLYSIASSPSALDSPPQSGPTAREGFGPQADESISPAPAKPYGAEVIWPVATGEVAALKDIKAEPVESALEREEHEEDTRLPKTQLGPQTFEPDKVVQTVVSGPAMPSPIANFDGGSKAEQGTNFSPPDTNGDIGYDPSTGKRYYFQWINIAYKAWDVSNPASPTIVVPLTQGNALWQAALPGSTCALTNDGDPIALFDEQAHRWLISQFSYKTGDFHQCVAVSKSADPAGGWYVYDYPYRDGMTYLNDYPHFGVWPDPIYNAYFMTVHQFNPVDMKTWLGQAVAAFDRTRLLSGSAAPMVLFDLYPINHNFGGMLAADLDGASPPAGTPGFFFEVDDSSFIGPSDALRIWEFKPNWTTLASSTFGLNGQANYTLTVAAFTPLKCGGSDPNCIPQSGTPNQLDTLADRLMHRVAFRMLNGITQTAVLNHTVDAGGTRAGVRWYQVQRNSTTGNWTILQQSTYAPADSVHRWMGSIATDRAGNIALGYSASSSSIVPAIRYAGRLVTNTISTLPQAEVTMTVSSGVQTRSNRWGDYAMMGVDPQDGCTFWFTEEYNGATGLNWKTRIGSFKFPGCTPILTGNLTGTVVSASNSNPISGALVIATYSNGAVSPAYTTASGYYQLLGIPTGSYTVTASAGGYQASTATGVAVSTGLTATQNFSLVSRRLYLPLITKQ